MGKQSYDSFRADQARELADACRESAQEAREKGADKSAQSMEREAARQDQYERGYKANEKSK